MRNSTKMTHLEADLAEEDLWMVPEGSLTLLEADLDLGPCPVDM